MTAARSIVTVSCRAVAVFPAAGPPVSSRGGRISRSVSRVSESDAVPRAERPATNRSIAQDLTNLGLGRGDSVLVHASLSSLGWVCGGSVAVVEALLSVLGPDGTLVVPTHSGDLSDPEGWQHPAVPTPWWDTIRTSMPPFRPQTPTRGMGAVAELTRTWPGARRSDHPHVSFAAVGSGADAITTGHRLDNSLGEHSPLARLYDRDAYVLLLGVGHDKNTSLHLAEYRAGVRRRVRQSGPVLVEGRRRWLTWDDVELDSDDFAALGADLERRGLVQLGPVAAATARLMRQRAVVDAATGWLRIHADAGPG